MMETHDWLDKIIEEQKGQAAILDRVCAPFTAAEVCEAVAEADELYSSNVCLSGNPAPADGLCGEPDCVCCAPAEGGTQ